MFEENHLYWIGVRESEIFDTGNLFNGSISVFGSNTKNNYSFEKEFSWRFDCNIDHKEWIDYINDKVSEIINKDPYCRFMLYYPADYPFYNENVRNRVLYLNDMDIISLLENKIQSKLWFSNCVTILPYSLEKSQNINLKRLESKFPQYTEFVIQASSSCGGSGTWLFSHQTASTIYNFLKRDERYIVTPYIPHSVSVNIHSIIYEKEVVLLPPSVQIISTENVNFSYNGGDFLSYRKLPQIIKDKVASHAHMIGDKLRDKGYRGVCGIDFLITESDIYLMEINSRFQASTILINKALTINSIPISVQLLHKDAFDNPNCSYNFSAFDVNYSFYCYSYHKDNFDKIRLLYDIQNEYAEFIECIDNDLDWSVSKDENTYLYEFVFEQSITALSPDFSCRLDPNININSGILDVTKWKNQLLELKIMLLNHGTRISLAAMQNLTKSGGVNYEEFYAIDMELCNLYINVPYNLGLTNLSPFEIDIDKSKNYVLKYWNYKISIVSLRLIDPLGSKAINNLKYNEISYLGVDRLRIYHRTGCFYKERNVGCKFCDIEVHNKQISVSEIKKVLDDYMDDPGIRHYLIGGGSNSSNTDFQTIIKIAKYIKMHTNKPIYLMCTPPTDISILKKLFQAGITEIAFNLEVFDRSIAKILMPGKGELSLDIYDASFKEAISIWGKNCKIRSAFIIGLERNETLFAGITHICQLGVSPILSLFKPIPGSPLEYMLPPSNKEIVEICCRVKEICKKYNIELGPTCPYCEDNTLKISTENFVPNT